MVRLIAIVTILLSLGFLTFGAKPAKAATVVCDGGLYTWYGASDVKYLNENGLIIFVTKNGNLKTVHQSNCEVE